MNHKFKIASINTLLSIKSFVGIDNLKDITNENMIDYMTYGVWALFGRKEGEMWICFQVGQSNNIGSEIISNVKCISGQIKPDKGRNYINQFGEIVEGYTYDVYLTPREQIYCQIGAEYNDFIFVCICCGKDYEDNKTAIEKYVAWKFRALFWRNGRTFKQPKENIKAPENIGRIDSNIKDAVDKLVEQYNKRGIERTINRKKYI